MTSEKTCLKRGHGFEISDIRNHRAFIKNHQEEHNER